MAGRRIAGERLAVLHVVALCLIACVAIGTILASHAWVTSHRENMSLVALSERQRMLIQRIALLDHEMRAAPGAGGGNAAAEIGAAHAMMLQTHAALARGNALLEAPGGAGDTGGAPSPDLDALMAEFTGIATRLATEGPEAVAEIRAQDARIRAALMAELERLIGAFRAEAGSALATVHRVEIGGFFAVLALLAAQGIAVMRPLLRRVRIDGDLLARASSDACTDALRDPATGAPNRRYLGEALQQVLHRAARAGESVAVLVADIDGLREVNARFGEEAGDLLLRSFHERLVATMRRGDLVARIGGDEFAVACPDVTGGARLAVLAERILQAVGEPLALGGTEVTTSCTVGISVRHPAGPATGMEAGGEAAGEMAAETAGETAGESCGESGAEHLIAEAEIALYDAKARGPGTFEFFSEASRAEAARTREVRAALQDALDGDGIEPFFQPQIDAATGALIGFEVLARWRHPEKGILPPGYFLDIARDLGAAGRIGAITRAQALKTLTVWRRQGFDVPRIAFNMAPAELRETELIDAFLWEIDRAGLTAEDVAVELAESTLIGDDDAPVMRNIRRLAAAGVALELDNFGTGRAALDCLRRFPVSRVKLDRSLIAAAREPDGDDFTRAVVALAATLGLDTLAEGIETAEDWRRLAHFGCGALQGYGIGEPMSGEECAEWMSTYARRRAPGPRRALTA